MADLLATPAVAVVSGAVLGLGLLALTLWSSRFVTPSNADLGPFAVMAAMTAGLILGLGLMVLYRWIAPDGFAYFGVAMVAGFVVALGVVTVRLLRSELSDDKRR